VYVSLCLRIVDLAAYFLYQQQQLLQQQQLRVPFPGLAPPNSLMPTPSPPVPLLSSSSAHYNSSLYAAPPSRASSHASPASIKPLDSPHAGVSAEIVALEAQSRALAAGSGSESGNFGSSSSSHSASSSHSVMAFPRFRVYSSLHCEIHIRSLVPQPRPAAQDDAGRPGKLAACTVTRWLLLACESSS
jgi:hypothetical protein